MEKIIPVYSTSKTSADIGTTYVIDKSTTTRKALRAKVVNNPNDNDACIEFTIFHQRKNSKDEWEDAASVPLSKLKSGEGVKLVFDSQQSQRLFQVLREIYGIGRLGTDSKDVVVAPKENTIVIDGYERECIQQLIEKNLEQEVWEQIVEQNPDIATKLSYARIQTERANAISEFEQSVSQSKPESFWQSYFEDNDWIFGYGLSLIYTHQIRGQSYLGGKDVSNRGGRVADYLLTTGGQSKYIAIVEIKRPDTHLLQTEKTRNGSYGVSKELSDVVAQVQGYSDEVARNCTDEWRDYEADMGFITVIPKSIIVIGHTKELSSREKRRSFELFRRGLHNIEIITYDELLERARFILDKKSQVKDPEPNVINLDEFPF